MRMAEHPGISLTVVHFAAGAELLEQEVKIDVTEESYSSIDLDKKCLTEIRKMSDEEKSVKFESRVVISFGEIVEAVKEVSGCNLILVGRSPVGAATGAVTVKIECPELGPVGNLLTSHELTTSASVLVVKQYDSSTCVSHAQTSTSTKVGECPGDDLETG